MLLGDSGLRLRGDDQIAAADVQFAIQNQRDRQRRVSLVKVSIVGDDARNLARFCRKEAR